MHACSAEGTDIQHIPYNGQERIAMSSRPALSELSPMRPAGRNVNEVINLCSPPQPQKKRSRSPAPALSSPRSRSLPFGTKRDARKRPAVKKGVSFVPASPRVHFFDPHNGHGPPAADDVNGANAGLANNDGSQQQSQLTEELTLLSTLHGRARRELRDISKHDFKTVMKYGTRTRGRTVSGDQRWVWEFGDTVVITNNACDKEITCYKKAIKIEKANITQDMLDDHKEAERILREEPHLCTTHSIIIIDQSASMKTCDVNRFRSRSDAAYGTLALDYIAEQLYQQGSDEFFVDACTVIEMSDVGSIVVNKEPLDWLLFNKVLDRLSSATPKSHGNYVESLEFAEDIINGELASYQDLDPDDLPAFMLLLISDGKPSDKSPEHETRRMNCITRLAVELKSKLTFLGMGIGASGSDFDQLELLVETAKQYGAEGHFNHAGLNPAALSTTLSSMATSMTTTRHDLLSTKDGKQAKTEKMYTMRQRKSDSSALVPIRRETKSVSRWLYDPSTFYPWRQVDFFDKKCSGFEVETDPIGKGAERLAYMFYEMRRKSNGVGWERAGGKAMVAKESRYIEDEETKETFHTDFCRAQGKAKDLAKLFNDAVRRAPLLKPSKDEVSLPPPIDFLKCSVYEYTNNQDMKCGLLVENYLSGRFTKFNSNTRFNLTGSHDDATIELEVGEVRLTDFVQAFSHWVYTHTNHSLVVCDLQGILDLEGRRPVFRLTDPAICSKGKRDRYGSSNRKHRYGKTDLGMRGIRNFCSSHVCNDVCKGLNLPQMGNGRRTKNNKLEH